MRRSNCDSLTSFRGHYSCQKMWPWFGLEFECAVYQITVITWLQRRIYTLHVISSALERQIKVSTWHFSPRHCSKWLEVFMSFCNFFCDGLRRLNKNESENKWELDKEQYLRNEVLSIKSHQIHFGLTWGKVLRQVLWMWNFTECIWLLSSHSCYVHLGAPVPSHLFFSSSSPSLLFWVWFYKTLVPKSVQKKGE